MGKTNKHFEREGFETDRRKQRHRVNNILSHIDLDNLEDDEVDMLHEDPYDSVKDIERVDKRTQHKKKNRWDYDPEN